MDDKLETAKERILEETGAFAMLPEYKPYGEILIDGWFTISDIKILKEILEEVTNEGNQDPNPTT